MARGKHKRRNKTKDDAAPCLPQGDQSESPLLSLPFELVDRIVNHLSPKEPALRSLTKTCRAFYRRYRLHLIVKAFEEGNRLRDVYYLEGAEEGQFGYNVFNIVDAQMTERGLMEEDEPDSVILFAVSHDLAEYHPTVPTREYCIVEITEEEVYVDDDYMDGDEEEVALDWEGVGQCLRRATPELVRSRWPCKECKETGYVTYGTPGLSVRWPELFRHEYLCDGPCVRCRVSYDEAIGFHEDLYDEMEAEMQALYREEMMEALMEQMYLSGVASDPE